MKCSQLEPMLGANEDVPCQRGMSVVKKPGWPIGPVGRSVFGSEPAQLWLGDCYVGPLD